MVQQILDVDFYCFQVGSIILLRQLLSSDVILDMVSTVRLVQEVLVVLHLRFADLQCRHRRRSQKCWSVHTGRDCSNFQFQLRLKIPPVLFLDAVTAEPIRVSIFGMNSDWHREGISVTRHQALGENSSGRCAPAFSEHASNDVILLLAPHFQLEHVQQASSHP